MTGQLTWVKMTAEVGWECVGCLARWMDSGHGHTPVSRALLAWLRLGGVVVTGFTTLPRPRCVLSSYGWNPVVRGTPHGE